MDGNVVMSVLCIIMAATLNVTLGFRPNNSPNDLLNHESRTHADITNVGVQKAISVYLMNRGLAGDNFDIIGGFFSSGW